jgi:hypothetical protein
MISTSFTPPEVQTNISLHTRLEAPSYFGLLLKPYEIAAPAIPDIRLVAQVTKSFRFAYTPTPRNNDANTSENTAMTIDHVVLNPS